jgi:NADH-ubiquinone oxidoreductase chain 1
MVAGWSSNSRYFLLGGLRALAQTVSYEVRLAFILFSFVVLICSYNLVYFYLFQFYVWLIFFLFSFVFCLVYFLFG